MITIKNKSGQSVTEFIIFLIILAMGLLILSLPFLIGIHYETSRGEHTGYVTAVDKTGIFFKTYDVYFKTDTQSSQEDIYCVQDLQVISDLKDAQATKKLITVQYYGWFMNSISDCGSGDEIIYSVNSGNMTQ